VITRLLGQHLTCNTRYIDQYIGPNVSIPAIFKSDSWKQLSQLLKMATGKKRPRRVAGSIRRISYTTDSFTSEHHYRILILLDIRSMNFYSKVQHMEGSNGRKFVICYDPRIFRVEQ